jgi:TATA-box binding protein (TBP) (component of TFIID and TFIIIB)
MHFVWNKNNYTLCGKIANNTKTTKASNKITCDKCKKRLQKKIDKIKERNTITIGNILATYKINKDIKL